MLLVISSAVFLYNTFLGSVSKNEDLRFMLYIKNNLWEIR